MVLGTSKANTLTAISVVVAAPVAVLAEELVVVEVELVDVEVVLAVLLLRSLALVQRWSGP